MEESQSNGSPFFERGNKMLKELKNKAELLEILDKYFIRRNVGAMIERDYADGYIVYPVRSWLGDKRGFMDVILTMWFDSNRKETTRFLKEEATAGHLPCGTYVGKDCDGLCYIAIHDYDEGGDRVITHEFKWSILK